ncbi:MAG: hypothetical protein WBA59_03870 [Moheibacter sp.]
MKKKTFYRSAVTGKFVSKEYADQHPETTTKETREVKTCSKQSKK